MFQQRKGPLKSLEHGACEDGRAAQTLVETLLTASRNRCILSEFGASIAGSGVVLLTWATCFSFVCSQLFDSTQCQ
jgi:hypothetical protein